MFEGLFKLGVYVLAVFAVGGILFLVVQAIGNVLGVGG